MKTLKTIALASTLVGGVASVASAFTTGTNPSNGHTIDYVHIAGAPAYRQDSIAVINAVVAAYGTPGAITASTSANSSGTGNASAQQWFIPQGVNSTTDLVISASFTGSTAGVEAVASGSTALAQAFIKDSQTTQAGSPVYGLSTSGSGAASYVPDLTLSDTFQPTTPFSGNVTLKQLQNPALPFNASTNKVVSNSYSFATLTGTALAVEPYVWVGSPGLHARGVTNITTAQAQNLFENGALPLSFFTGNAADSGATVYALSRDPGSGSRLIAVAETGVGVTTTIKTYQPTVTGAAANPNDSAGNYVAGTIDSTNPPPLYAAGTIASTLVYDPNAGDTGYPKFGTTDQKGLLAAITSTPSGNAASPSTAEYFITYLNPSDAAEAVTYGGAEQLTYNGLSYNPANPANLENGQYTFWSYEEAYPSATISGAAQSVFNAIVAKWPTLTLSTGVPLSALNVTRSIDGGTVTYSGF